MEIVLLAKSLQRGGALMAQTRAVYIPRIAAQRGTPRQVRMVNCAGAGMRPDSEIETDSEAAAG